MSENKRKSVEIDPEAPEIFNIRNSIDEDGKATLANTEANLKKAMTVPYASPVEAQRQANVQPLYHRHSIHYGIEVGHQHLNRTPPSTSEEDSEYSSNGCYKLAENIECFDHNKLLEIAFSDKSII